MERGGETETDPVTSAAEYFDEMTIAQGERWAPLGAAREDPELMDSAYSVDSDYWPRYIFVNKYPIVRNRL